MSSLEPAPLAPPVITAAVVAGSPARRHLGHAGLSNGLRSVFGLALIGAMGVGEVGLRIGHFFGRRFG